MTACGASRSHSVEFAPARPATLRELHHGELHAEADPEERDALGARVADGSDLALGSAIAEAARYEHGVEARQRPLGTLLVDPLGVDVLELHLAVVRHAAVDEGLVERPCTNP